MVKVAGSFELSFELFEGFWALRGFEAWGVWWVHLVRAVFFAGKQCLEVKLCCDRQPRIPGSTRVSKMERRGGGI